MARLLHVNSGAVVNVPQAKSVRLLRWGFTSVEKPTKPPKPPTKKPST